MTSAGGRHPFTVAAWIIVAAMLVAGVVAVVGDILSSALVVDLVAMWPLLVLVVAVGLVAWWRSRRSGTPRAGAILPLSIISVLVLAVAVHLGGWDELPSAETRLVGPPPTELSSTVALTAQIDGRLLVGAVAGGAAYTVDPILRGGGVGVPEAVETSVDGEISIEMQAADAPDWYRFAGWDLGLSPDLSWRLVLNGAMEANLSDLPVEALAAGGSGSVALGDPPDGGGSVVVSGAFALSIPAGAAAVARGEVVVPDGWDEDGDTVRSPADGAAWRIRVEGDTPVRITERS